MTLKRLEMQGFKSFAKKAVFDFSAPVTSIVGPNGSGKSNVVEAIRFVLGEQSTKSLRSKSGADLIFKGSKQISKLNRASVSITFDNTKRIFSLPAMDDQNLSLDFDEITISREVFADGTNAYSLNGNEVRLKDIHELIASVNIGSSGHHIISQGEADRLLNSKPAERREMLEESLGLKLYHYRIKEGERKLDKTREHVKEAESLRRELAPHIKFLKKQVEKIEKAREIETALKDLYQNYLVQEQTLLARKKTENDVTLHSLQAEIRALDEKLSELGNNKSNAETSKLESHIVSLRNQIRELSRNRDDLGRQIGRVEGMIESAKKIQTVVKHSEGGTVPLSDIEAFIGDIEEQIELAIDAPDDYHLRQTLSDIATKLHKFIEQKRGHKHSGGEPEIVSVDTTEFEATKKSLEAQTISIDAQISSFEAEIAETEASISESRGQYLDRERMFYEMQSKKSEAFSRKNILESAHHDISARLHELAEEYLHAEQLVGSHIVDLKTHVLPDDVHIDEGALRVMHHEIERMKIRLEDVGGGSGGDVMQEYDETVTRDQFLEKEITDLYTALETIDSTIRDLKEKLSTEFHTGIVKINKEFEGFFRLMFGGGDARLQVVDIEKRKKKASDGESEESEIEDIENEGEEKEKGIDIDVSLPRKKVKDLEMLSGGERSLTSIALLFALSQVNPPPFLVLDETDAALDEANSQKYGDMIENLAKETQLVVVTHNRETMSRADILYGVTLGSDDASTLLSIRFEEAVKVAK